jgi:hypothetical protein
MMEDLMFVAALGTLTIMSFGALAIAATFLLVKNMLEAGHSDFETGERFALEETNRDAR